MLKYFLGSRNKKLSGIAILITAILALRYYNQKKHKAIVSTNMPEKPLRKKSRVAVDKEFLNQVLDLLKIALPSWKSKQAGLLIVLTILLTIRTILSIRLAGVTGRIVKAIINKDLNLFLQRLMILGLYAIPGSAINSSLDYLNKRIALLFREELSKYFNNRYIKGKIYY